MKYARIPLQSQRPRVAAALIVLALASCMISPENGDAVGSDGVVAFRGFGTAPSQTFVVQSSASAAGPFSDVATVQATTTPTNFRSESVYEWEVDAAVDTWSDLGHCEQEAFVRARVGSYYALTFEQEAFQCIATAYFGGQDIYNAALACQSPDAPIARITRTLHTTHVGNVVIATQSEADAFACIGTIDGSLTIVDDPAELSIALPNLQEVTGDVVLAYSRDPVAGYSYPPLRTFDLSSLTTIGGDLDATYVGQSNDLIDLDVELDALVSIGGSVSVSATTFNMSLHGLDNLLNVPGDVSIECSGDDLTAYGWLGDLQLVGGDVYVETGHTTIGLYPDLQDVGGDLTMVGTVLPPQTTNFSSLFTVGGDLSFIGGDVTTPPGFAPHLPSLGVVDGVLEIDAAGGFENLSVGDEIGGLSLGGLILNATALQNLSPTYWQVQGTGPITITDHTGLSSCEVDDFAASQAGLGWSGTLVNTGNGGC